MEGLAHQSDKHKNIFSRRLIGRVAVLGTALIVANSGLPDTSDMQTQTAKAAKTSIDSYPWSSAPKILMPPAKDNITWGYIDKASCDSASDEYDCSGATLGADPKYYYRDQWGYDLRNCTSYVAWRINKEFGVDMSGLGDGGSWDDNFGDQNRVNNTPEPGDAAVFDPSSPLGWGHVAFVEEVVNDAEGNPKQVVISQYNNNLDGNPTTETVSISSVSKFVDPNGEGVGMDGQPVSIKAKVETKETGDPFGNIDKVRRYPGGLRLEGWAMDPDTQQPIDVHVYSGDGYVKPEQFKGLFNANLERKDIDTWNNGSNHGFVYDFLLEDKQHTICLYGINKAGVGKNRRFACSDQTLSGNGVGQMDQFFRSPGGVTAKGWAFDPDTNQPNEVQFFEGTTTEPSKLIGGTTANKERKDVFVSLANQYVGYSDYHGFDKSLSLGSGYHKVCAYSLNAPSTSGETKWMNCGEITIFNDPKGYLESLTRSGGTVSLRGWVLDPDIYGAVNVHVYGGDGSANPSKFMGGFPADLPRQDIVVGNPGYGDKHGYEKTLTLPSGTWRVCVYALNAPGTPGGNLVMGCKNV